MSNKPCNFDWSTYTGPPWARATLACTANNYSQFTLNMRRKAEILKYKNNQNNLTKKQQWSMLNRGLLSRKKTWATQGINGISNPNTNDLNLLNNTLVCDSNSVEPLIIINSSSASGVPGNSIGLYLDPSVPLTNYKNQITYSTGGKNMPEKNWYPEDYVFPAGTDGSIVFNKSSSVTYIEYPNNIGINSLAIGTEDFTIEWWQYWTPIETFNDVRVFSIGSFSEGNINIAFTFKNKEDFTNKTESSDNIGGILFWKPSLNGSDNVHIVSYDLPYQYTWTHFAIVGYSNEKIEFYINGIKASTDNTPYNFTEQNYPLIIGQDYDSTNLDSNFFGKITNFRWVIGYKVYTSEFNPSVKQPYNIEGTRLLLLSKNTANVVKDSSYYSRMPINYGVTYSSDIPVPFVPMLYSNDNITQGTYQIGEQIIKNDLSILDYRTIFNPTYYNMLFVDSKYFIFENIDDGNNNIENKHACGWDNTNDTSNNLLINWGYFYLYDVNSKRFYLPQFRNLELIEGLISTEIFYAFDRKFIIKYGWAVTGIYKIEISVNDNLPFKFGCYGEISSDNIESEDFNVNYTIDSNPLTLYYHSDKDKNIDSISKDINKNKKMYSYWIPKVISENNQVVPYTVKYKNTYMSALSKSVTRGIIIYFGFVNDVKEWVINDITIL